VVQEVLRIGVEAGVYKGARHHHQSTPGARRHHSDYHPQDRECGRRVAGSGCSVRGGGQGRAGACAGRRGVRDLLAPGSNSPGRTTSPNCISGSRSFRRLLGSATRSLRAILPIPCRGSERQSRAAPPSPKRVRCLVPRLGSRCCTVLYAKQNPCDLIDQSLFAPVIVPWFQFRDGKSAAP
jgi:hypothetical protein